MARQSFVLIFSLLFLLFQLQVAKGDFVSPYATHTTIYHHKDLQKLFPSLFQSPLGGPGFSGTFFQ